MEPDASDLFALYTHLQNLMTHHVEIDASLKELSLNQSKPQEFELIENAASAIIDTCNQIEKVVTPPRCNCCQLA